MINILKEFFMTDAEVRNAAWDFYTMGNELASKLCILELMRRDPVATKAWIDDRTPEALSTIRP